LLLCTKQPFVTRCHLSIITIITEVVAFSFIILIIILVIALFYYILSYPIMSLGITFVSNNITVIIIHLAVVVNTIVILASVANSEDIYKPFLII